MQWDPANYGDQCCSNSPAVNFVNLFPFNCQSSSSICFDPTEFVGV
jgi:hypothetical protein